MNPKFKQDERNEDREQVGRIEPAVPEMLDRVGIERMDDEDQRCEQDGSPDQRLDANQFGSQHLLGQRVPKIGGYRRLRALIAP